MAIILRSLLNNARAKGKVLTPGQLTRARHNRALEEGKKYIRVNSGEEKYILSHPAIRVRRALNDDFNDPDYARDWLIRSNLYNSHTPPPPPFTDANGNVIPEPAPKHSIFDLLDRSSALIAKKESDIGTYPFRPYSGQTITNAAPNQIKLLGLEDYYTNKSAPYHKKMQRNLQTNFDIASVDFKTARLNEIRNQSLNAVNYDFLSSIFGDRLDKQRLSNLYADTSKNLDTGLNMAAKEYEKLNEANRLQQKVKQNILHGVLGKLATDKQSKRDLYLQHLKAAANQEHGIKNLQLRAEKFKYDEEQATPAKKLQALKHKLANITAGGIREDMDSSTLDAKGEQISRLLSRYEADSRNPQGYQGKIAAGISPALQSSWDLLNQMSPNYKSSVYGDKKALEKKMLGTANPLVLNQKDDYTNSQEAIILGEYQDAKQRLVEATKNKHAKLGMFGTTQHQDELQSGLGQLEEKLLNNLSALNLEKDRGYLENKAKEDGLDLARLQNLSDLDRGMSEKIYDIPKLMNKKGVKAFQDESEANQELYNNYYNQNSWAYDDQVAINKEQGKSELIKGIYGSLGISPSKLDIDDFAKQTQQNYAMNKFNQEQVSDYISKLSQLQSQFDQQKLNITGLENQKAEVEQHYQSALNDKLKLESELIHARNQLKIAPQSPYTQEKINQLQVALSANKMNLAQLQNSLREMQSVISSKDNEINSYKSYIDRLTGEKNSMQKVLGQTQSQLNVLEKQKQVEQEKQRRYQEQQAKQAQEAANEAAYYAKRQREYNETTEAIKAEMVAAGWQWNGGRSFITKVPLVYGNYRYAPNSTYTR